MRLRARLNRDCNTRGRDRELYVELNAAFVPTYRFEGSLYFVDQADFIRSAKEQKKGSNRAP